MKPTAPSFLEFLVRALRQGTLDPTTPTEQDYPGRLAPNAGATLTQRSGITTPDSVGVRG